MKVAATLVLLVVVFAGCSDRGGFKLAKVTGTVKLDGAPVEGAGLEFISDAGGVAYGRTDTSGEYYMSFGSSSTGAVVGRNLVRISASDKVTVGGKKYESTEVFPKKYNANSEQYVNVVPGSNRFDFNCESAGFKGQPSVSSGGN
jgi:hypothetical protein